MPDKKEFDLNPVFEDIRDIAQEHYNKMLVELCQAFYKHHFGYEAPSIPAVDTDTPDESFAWEYKGKQ